ncbi:MAG: repair protein SbcD/Mre11 [Actinomycetota bacterium]|nr:repair protein SbcD/Mre11 [Actinomycetota bacterium]
MKLLHTADWHVGKQLRGRSRLDEHRRVLAEIAKVAADEQVDVVLVVGDLFETTAPTPDAQRVVWDALLGLRATGAEVVAVAGNHDNAFGFDAFRPLCAAAGITLLGHPAPADAGGVVALTASDGTPVRIGLLPFVSQRYAVRAHELFELTSAGAVGEYASTIREMIAALEGGFDADAVNVLAVHATVANAQLGGGEREAQTIFDYYVPPTVFPASAHYVALGHLHRTQAVPAAPPAWYSGSPIQVDFGEGQDDKHVLIVDAQPRSRAVVRTVRLTTPDTLRTVRGTIGDLEAGAESYGDAWLRVVVQEAPRAGLAEEVRSLLPRAVDVRVESPDPLDGSDARLPTRIGRAPNELFGEFLTDRGINDRRLVALFQELLDDATHEVHA